MGDTWSETLAGWWLEPTVETNADGVATVRARTGVHEVRVAVDGGDDAGATATERSKSTPRGRTCPSRDRTGSECAGGTALSVREKRGTMWEDSIGSGISP
jgi:hypothetical protein